MKVIKLLAVILVGILVTGCSGKKNETNSTNEQSSSSSERFPDSMDDKEAFNATVNSSSTANEKKATQIEMVETDNGYFKVTLLENWQTVDTNKATNRSATKKYKPFNETKND